MTEATISEASDEELVKRYKNGDVDALDLLVERYRRPLYGFILNMTEGRADADEFFQDVWFRVIRNLDRYRQKNFPGWLMRIAHNLIIDKARRRKPEVSMDQQTEDGMSLANILAGNEPEPSAALDATDLGRCIMTATDTLPEEQKEVLMLRVADIPFKEIAKIQGVSINTALARMQYALTKLRPLLQDSYDALSR